jgi:NADH-quinone oxidoreductase subunit N
VLPAVSASTTTAMTDVIRMVIPEVTLVGTACALFAMAATAAGRGATLLTMLAGVFLSAIFAAHFGPLESSLLGSDPASIYRLTIDPTGAASFIRWLSIATAGLLSLLVFRDVVERHAGEFYGCLAVAAAGVSLVGRAHDLVVLYLALEMISIPTYILLYLPARSKAGQEAALKYFLLSILSSAILLFGFSYLYGATGTTNLTAIKDILTGANTQSVSIVTLFGIILTLVGVAFRLAAVPFHFYAPDVYQSGPTGVVGMLAVWPKIAGMTALVKLLGLADANPAKQPFDTTTIIPYAIVVLASVSMTFGNLVALLQTNLKRIMAYSGIAHAGYLLTALAATGSGGSAGIESIYFYLAAYAFMTLGFFAVIRAIDSPERPVESIDDLAGLAAEKPMLAAALAVSLLGMIGIPLTAGFVGKLNIFVAALTAPADTPMGQGFRILAAVMAVNAAIGAVYYLRILTTIYFRTALRPFQSACELAGTAAVICSGISLAMGIYPKPVVDAARIAAYVVPSAKITAK